MPPVECGRCGERFDPHRETLNPHMSSARCPHCGWKYDLDPQTDGGGAVADGAPSLEDTIPAPVTVDVPERVLERAAEQLAGRDGAGRGAAAERLLDYLDLRFTYRTADGDDAVRVVLERARDRGDNG